MSVLSIISSTPLNETIGFQNMSIYEQINLMPKVQDQQEILQGIQHDEIFLQQNQQNLANPTSFTDQPGLNSVTTINSAMSQASNINSIQHLFPNFNDNLTIDQLVMFMKYSQKLDIVITIGEGNCLVGIDGNVLDNFQFYDLYKKIEHLKIKAKKKRMRRAKNGKSSEGGDSDTDSISSPDGKSEDISDSEGGGGGDSTIEESDYERPESEDEATDSNVDDLNYHDHVDGKSDREDRTDNSDENGGMSEFHDSLEEEDDMDDEYLARVGYHEENDPFNSEKSKSSHEIAYDDYYYQDYYDM